MSSILQKAAWLVGPTVLAIGAWACVATRNADGSYTVQITPELSIRAWGLEDALEKLLELLGNCQAGTYVRPCTDADMDAISAKITEVVQAKIRLDDHPQQGGTITI